MATAEEEEEEEATTEVETTLGATEAVAAAAARPAATATTAHRPQDHGRGTTSTNTESGDNLFDLLQRELSYYPQTKVEQTKCRQKYGFCIDCPDVRPTLLYKTTHAYSGPLRKTNMITREAINEAGLCGDGICFSCHPEQDPSGLAMKRYNDEKEFIMKELSLNGRYPSLQSCSYKIRDDKEVILQVLKAYNSPSYGVLRVVSPRLQDDEDVVLASITRNSNIFKVNSGNDIQYASKRLQCKKGIAMIAIQNSTEGMAFQHIIAQQKQQPQTTTSTLINDDKDIVLCAMKKNGNLLKYASRRLRGDKECVTAAVSNAPTSLQFACNGLNQDRDCLIAAGLWDSNYGDNDSDDDGHNGGDRGLHASSDDDHDSETFDHKRMMTTTSQPATATGPTLAVSSAPYSSRRIVLSTRFSLGEKSSPTATTFTVLLKKHPYFRRLQQQPHRNSNDDNEDKKDPLVQSNSYTIYSPNAYTKDTCDPAWTNKAWPCRGTFATCQKESAFKIGQPTNRSCWRYSFRYQLQLAKLTNGFLIQVVEHDPTPPPTSTFRNNYYDRFQPSLGKGQEIETYMAREVGTKVFRIYEPLMEASTTTKTETMAIAKTMRSLFLPGGGGVKRRCFSVPFVKKDIDRLVECIKEWNNKDQNCLDVNDVVEIYCHRE